MAYASYDEYEMDNLNPAEIRVPLEMDQYEHALDHLHGLIDAIYKTGDISALESHLEEVLWAFRLQLPSSLPKLTTESAKQTQTNDMLKDWKEFNTSYATQLACN